MASQRTRGLVAVRSVRGAGRGSVVGSASGGRSPLNAVALAALDLPVCQRAWSRPAQVLMLFVGFVLAAAVAARDIETFEARSIDVSRGEVTLLRHKKILLGLTCSSGPEGILTGLRTISLGDTITHKKLSFRVGLIEVSKFHKDAEWSGTKIAKKGDVVCVVERIETLFRAIATVMRSGSGSRTAGPFGEGG